MLRRSLWLAADPDAPRALTSGTLEERDGGDDVLTLYCDGVVVTAPFAVPAGRGEVFLADCGLVRQ